MKDTVSKTFVLRELLVGERQRQTFEIITFGAAQLKKVSCCRDSRVKRKRVVARIQATSG